MIQLALIASLLAAPGGGSPNGNNPYAYESTYCGPSGSCAIGQGCFVSDAGFSYCWQFYTDGGFSLANQGSTSGGGGSTAPSHYALEPTLFTADGGDGGINDWVDSSGNFTFNGNQCIGWDGGESICAAATNPANGYGAPTLVLANADGLVLKDTSSPPNLCAIGGAGSLAGGVQCDDTYGDYWKIQNGVGLFETYLGDGIFLLAPGAPEMANESGNVLSLNGGALWTAGKVIVDGGVDVGYNLHVANSVFVDGGILDENFLTANGIVTFNGLSAYFYNSTVTMNNGEYWPANGGLIMAGQQINNLAAGTSPTDAVNLSQISGSLAVSGYNGNTSLTWTNVPVGVQQALAAGQARDLGVVIDQIGTTAANPGSSNATFAMVDVYPDGGNGVLCYMTANVCCTNTSGGCSLTTYPLGESFAVNNCSGTYAAGDKIGVEVLDAGTCATLPIFTINGGGR